MDTDFTPERRRKHEAFHAACEPLVKETLDIHRNLRGYKLVVTESDNTIVSFYPKFTPEQEARLEEIQEEIKSLAKTHLA